jgi:hypothetical protein
MSAVRFCPLMGGRGAGEQRGRGAEGQGSGGAEGQRGRGDNLLPITHYPLPITHYPLPITPDMGCRFYLQKRWR